jgi:FkbM family methyltransferase
MDIGDLYFDLRDTNLTPIVRREPEMGGRRGRVHPSAARARDDAGGRRRARRHFSVLASGIVGRSGRIFAIEVEPRNLSLLRANLWRRGCNNVTVLPVAAYDRRGHVRFFSNPDGLSGSSIDAEEGAAVRMLPCARLDDLLGATVVDVIKIDVERVEPEVIRGAEALIHATPTLDIVTEFWPRDPSYGGGTPADVLDYYESLGLELGC